MTSAQDWGKVGLAALLALALCAAVGTAVAQEFPVKSKPITILLGEPMDPADWPDTNAMTVELKSRLSALVDRAQREYPDKPAGPDDAWWQPAHLGGTAPTLEEAAELDRRGRRTAAS